MNRYKIKYKYNLTGGIELKLKSTVTISDKDNEIFRKKNYNHTFGFLTNNGFNKMILISKIKLSKKLDNKTFVDLGSGDGRIVVWASKYFKNSIGIELSETRFNEAQKIKSQIPNSENIKFFNKDVLDHDYSKFDVIYISSLLFPDHLMKKITEKLDNEIKHDALIFTTKKLHNNKNYNIFKIQQSWADNSNLHVYKY